MRPLLPSIILAFATFARPASALDPNILISQYGHTVWRVQDGALSETPTALAQTPDGYIWVGTQRGLYLFDGVSFTAWTPPSSQPKLSSDTIASLYAARDGSL
jgi:ligand-binding sensor domain-containing protein